MGCLGCNFNSISPNLVFTKKPLLSYFPISPVRFRPSAGHSIKIKSIFKMDSNPALTRASLGSAILTSLFFDSDSHHRARSEAVTTYLSITQKKITIPNKYNEKLVGILHDTGSPDIVVLCHGFRSKKENRIMLSLAAALEKEGISAFRFDFTGNGESEGSFKYGHYQREADDLRSVVEHFIGQNCRVIAILGHSKGGNVVLLYASKYHDVLTVVNVSGRYDLYRGIGERLGSDFLERIKKDGFIDVRNMEGEVPYRVTEESLMDRLNTNMHEACSQIDRGCRVLTIHGSNDGVIPMEDASAFDKVIPNHKLRIIEGADHLYMSHQSELVSLAISFIKEGLQQN